jgi:hypothetical protein
MIATELTLNGPGVLTLSNRRKGIVETHRDVANEQAARIGDFYPGRGAVNQTIGFKIRQRFDFALKM